MKGKKIVVVMPAYNAAKTLRKTCTEVWDEGIVDLIIVVDDCSTDQTVEIAKSLGDGIKVYCHQENKGYGGNQKTCYSMALSEGADVVIMIHPDYQYTPKLLTAIASMLTNDLYACVLGSRMITGYALKGGMPIWKYIGNRFLTVTENILLRAHLSEYHTGYRGFTAEILRTIPFRSNSDDFVFDNQMLAQIIWYGFPIGEVSCPTSYHEEASSVGFRRSVKYGLGCLWTALKFRMAKWSLMGSPMFPKGTAGPQ